MTARPELSLTIGSRFEDLELVDQLLEEVASRRRFSDGDLSDLLLATREAVANAVRHGNRMDPEKPVVVEIRLELETLVISVRDRGDGFDLDALPDPLDPANLLKPSGRGIFLMRQLMDEVAFEFPEGGGTLVTMRRSSPDPRPDTSRG